MSLDRRAFLASGLAAAFAGPALAKAPLAGRQAAGIYRHNVGSIEVTALSDGWITLEPKLFPDAKPDEAEQLLKNAFLDPQKIPTSVNAYLVNTGERLILIDAGTGKAMGPNLGRLAANLAAAGVDPASVDTVLLTHLHIDHVTGLLGEGGVAFFPKAEIIVAESEYAFWHDDGMMSRAPAEAKGSFEIARAGLKPYADRTRRIADGTEVLPGIAAIAAPGHTPGHTLYRITSGNSALLIWGDIVHTAALQFPRPELSLAFDTDQAMARQTRAKVFDTVSADGVAVAGMHLGFPGLGHVAKDGKAYRFVPTFWSPDL